jgi:carboxyvinyl-carboxyphosphonate phosphorylmutase
MKATELRGKFRCSLDSGECYSPASVFDPMSARMAETLGFEMGVFAGSIASFTVLGAPDLVLLTLTEFADQARRICRAANLPLMVDADHGYGNGLNVKRTVEEVEAAGVSALTIEDTLLPAPFKGFAQKELISVAEGVGKVRAALAGRQDPSLVIVARTSAVPINGLEDAVRRLQAYQAAGADAVFVAGLTTREQLDAIASTIKLPIMLGQAASSLRDTAYLRARHVGVYFEGHHPFYAGIRTLYETLQALRNGAAVGTIPVASNELIKQLTNQKNYDEWSDQFLNSPDREIK